MRRQKICLANAIKILNTDSLDFFALMTSCLSSCAAIVSQLQAAFEFWIL